MYPSTEDRMTEQELEKVLVQSMKETKQEDEKIRQLIKQAPKHLHKQGYPETDLSFSRIDRKFIVHVSDKELLQREKDEIKVLLSNDIKEKGLENMDIDFMYVDKSREKVEKTETEKTVDQVSKIAIEVLSEQGMPSYSFQVFPNESIQIEIQETNISDNKKRKWKEAISNKVYEGTQVKYQVNFSEISETDQADQSWSPVFHSIQDQMSKHFEEYRGFAFSFHPQPLQIIIKTHVGFWSWNSEEKVKEIERYVNKIIELKKEEIKVEEIPYEIIIRDKNNDRIN